MAATSSPPTPTCTPAFTTFSSNTCSQNLPDDWQCPVCGGQKDIFITKQKEVAGFAENQGYGLGANSMTGEQKSLTIFGSLLFFFVLFILGYFLN